jgi:hypothetical protein
MQYSVDVLDHLTAPKLTSLTVCGAAEVPELPDYNVVLKLKQALNRQSPALNILMTMSVYT